MINISHYQCTLRVCRNSQTETYFVESPNIQYTRVHHVSHFNPTEIARHSYFTYYNSKDVFAQLLKCSTTMQTPSSPSIDIHGLNKVAQGTKEDNDEQTFYSAPPSRILF